MVKLAKTNEELQKCFNYLNSKGTIPATEELYYVERDGEITACSGLTVVPEIEPLQAENNIDAYSLFNYMLGVAESRARLIGSKYITCCTNNIRAENIIKKYNFTFWTNKIKQFIKGV